MTDLLPCPFCGGTEFEIVDSFDDAAMVVECQKCAAHGPAADALTNIHPYTRRPLTEIETDARRLWNQRDKPTP